MRRDERAEATDPLPRAALASWMDRRGIGAGPIDAIVPLSGGTQNRVIAFRRGVERYVLRAGPVHPRPGSDEITRREARITGALGPTGVPVPEVVAVEGDPTVLGCAFYLMRPVDGSTFVAAMDHFDGHADAKHRVGLAMVESLVRLAQVDHTTLDLTDFGRPDGFLERQVARWSDQLAGYRGAPGYHGHGLDLTPIERWLTARLPSDRPVGIMHGDFHIANVLFDSRGEVAAIVDWEISTIGDPMLDFAHLLVTWPTPDSPAFADLVPSARAHGLAAPDELVAHYEERSGRPVEHLDWYRVLAAYRLGVLIEGTYVRSCAGAAPRSTGEVLHTSALQLWTDALAHVAHDTVEPAR